MFTSHRKQEAIDECKVTLKDLGLQYLDLYLNHFPFSYKEVDGKMIDDPVPLRETWGLGSEELKQQGLVRNIGVSNFNV